MKINPQTKEEIKRLIKEKVNRDKEKVVVYSAQELTPDQKRLLDQKLHFSDAKQISYEVNPSLIAGVVIKRGSKITDLSVYGTLTNLHSLIYDSI